MTNRQITVGQNTTELNRQITVGQNTTELNRQITVGQNTTEQTDYSWAEYYCTELAEDVRLADDKVSD